MKKIIVIISLFSIVFSATELYQLLKIPVLIAHYLEHQNQTTDMSIAEFFSVHYSKAIADDEDAERDMQLPFKTHECAGQLLITLEDNSKPFTLQSPMREVRQTHWSLQNNDLPPGFYTDIWQPPRIS